MNIEKLTLIDKRKLDNRLYFSSLLEEAAAHGMLTDTDIEGLQLACLSLLAAKTDDYTGGNSSSIKTEVAESLFSSNVYTIGLFLKTFPTPDLAVEALKNTPLPQLYAGGRALINTKLRSAGFAHKTAMKTMTPVTNITYRATVVDGIKGFFKLYKPDFEAHKINITADYPLCNPIENSEGIEFIQKYLEAINYENAFCSRFPPNSIENLLCGHGAVRSDLILNIFEQVFTSAIGCILAGIDLRELKLSAVQVEAVYSQLIGKSKPQTIMLIENIFQTLLSDLAISSVPLRNYMKTALPKITSAIFNGAAIDKLEKVFL